MLGSTNPFFYEQSQETLKEIRFKINTYLTLKNRSDLDIYHYLKAYDFFCIRPHKYDGATIVKDLVDIRKGKYYLDLDAMYHDYDYVMGANRNFVKKWKSDYKYIKNMELNGKGIRVFRLFILTFLGAYIPIQKFVRQWI